MTASHLHLRVRYIFIPLVASTVGFCIAYSTLDWLLVARSNLIRLSDGVAGYWLPLALAFFLVIFTLRPSLKLLKRDKAGRLGPLYFWAAVATLAVPTIVAQGFVRSATGDLSHVGSLADISSSSDTKYYSADRVCIDRSRAWTQPVTRLAGRSNDSLNYYVYVIVPLCSADRARSSESIWFGYQFHKLLGNSASPEEKDAAYRDLWKQALSALNEQDPSAFPFFERLGQTWYRKDFANLLGRAGIDLEAHTERFADRSGHQLQWAIASIGLGTAAWLAIALLCPLVPPRERKWIEGEGGGTSDQTRANVLLFVKGAYGLVALLGVNVLVFVAMVLSGLDAASFDSDDLLRWGANYGPSLHGIGYARLITSQFVHGGIWHLVNNLYGLVLAGLFVLPVTGNLGLIACYVFAGLGGSIASAYIHPATVSVGASGAIFGLFAMLLVHLVLGDKKLIQVRARLLPGIALFVALNFLIGAASQGVDNAAHIGGFLAGIVLGLILDLPRFGGRVVITKPSSS